MNRQLCDYADLNVPMLSRMFDRRCRGYEAIGYTILLPASTIPGWPIDVILPSEPDWKRDYSGSVQRLVRDGVETPLATLFLTRLERFMRMRKVLTAHAVRPRPSYSSDWKPWRKRRDASASTSACRSHSTRAARLTWTCSALRDVGKELDRVLDTILKAPGRRRS
jgi:hypothetical protein